MSKDALQEDMHAWPDTGVRQDSQASSPASESGDSFLREVLQVEPSSRLPVPGQWLGGLEGRRS